MKREYFQQGKKPLLTLLILALLLLQAQGVEANPGEAVFKTHCASCHNIGGGRLVGPDLKGVSDRLDKAWLTKFIKAPKAVIDSGDKYAVELFNKFNKILMPDSTISNKEIAQVLAYIKTTSATAGTVATITEEVAPESEAPKPTEADVAAGRDLFQGKIRFMNGGAACNSCHHIQNDAVIGGGILAKELTNVFSTMGSTGIRAVLGRPPFAVMDAAYKDKPLTEVEIFKLVAFLQDADTKKAYRDPLDYGVGLFGAGVLGAFLILFLYQVLWWNRKKSSVNQEIYDRQGASTTDW